LLTTLSLYPFSPLPCLLSLDLSLCGSCSCNC
jgi:hypothetical protein